MGKLRGRTERENGCCWGASEGDIHFLYWLICQSNFMVNVGRHHFTKKVDQIARNSNTGVHVAKFVDDHTKKEFFSQPKGLVCQNIACGLDTNILIGKDRICRKCKITGHPQNSLRGFFCPVCSLSLNPVMVVRFIARNSRGLAVKRRMCVR